MIARFHRKWALVSREGKVLGLHDTKHEAEAQERAIRISKARRAGHRIPNPPHRRGKRK